MTDIARALPGAVRLERRFTASPERVFAALTKPEHVKHWFGGGEYEVPQATIDLRVGGRFHFAVKAPDGTLCGVKGEYREVAPGKRLSFTWNVYGTDHDSEGSVVTMTLEPDGGGTRFTLSHTGFGDQDYARDNTRRGWDICTDALERYTAAG